MNGKEQAVQEIERGGILHMGANDVATLDAVISSVKQDSDPSTKVDEAEFFDFFVASLLLREKDLPAESIQAGVTDGSRDCGVDAMYTFLEGHLVEDAQMSTKARPPRFVVHIIQCKRSMRFEEEAINNFAYYLPKLLVLDRELDDLRTFCNAKVIDRSGLFLDTFRRLAGRGPMVELNIHYASRGSHVHPNLRARADTVAGELARLFKECEVNFHFHTAGNLLDRHRARRTLERELLSAVPPMYSETEQGYACLVRFSDYFDLLTNGFGDLDQELFEFNVRDHEGDSTVNDSIRATLETNDSESEFWWLNNGVTIVASAIEPMNKRLALTDPQIVNGLQTSTEIYRHLKANGHKGDSRLLLVRAIAATDQSVRDSIVRATNSQNSMPPSALRSTERIHRNIEESFAKHGFWYERRHKYYENLCKPHDRLVTMRKLGRSLAAVLLQRPDLARIDSDSLFEDRELYKQLFSQNYPENVYLNSLLIVRRCEAAWDASDVRQEGLKDDWIFLLATICSILYFKKQRPGYEDLAKFNIGSLPTSAVLDLRPIIAVEFNKASATRARPFRELASDKRVCDSVIERARSFTTSRNWRSWPQEQIDAQYALRPGESMSLASRA
jgi:hypothetical protein